MMDRAWADAGCAAAAPPPGALGSWEEARRLVVGAATSTQEGLVELARKQGAVADVVYDPAAEAACPLGHLALRLALYLLMGGLERAAHLCSEPARSILGAPVVRVLASGWPIFGLMGLLAYRLVRDGSAPGWDPAGGRPECGEVAESFRVRYLPAAFQSEDVRFSRDVEAAAAALLRGLANATQRCLLAGALPLLGHAASVQCLARRGAPLRAHVEGLLELAGSAFLRRAAAARPRGLGGEAFRACGGSGPARRAALSGSLLSLLAAGLWAAEALALLQRAAAAFASHEPRPPLGGPEPPPGSDVVVSFDPQESRFYGRGLPDFVEHVWGGGALPGFCVRPALPCADVLVVRDSLPGLPFPGALVYIDHEAGIGPGRDAGRLDAELQKYRVVYLGVLEPAAETRCASRAQGHRRVCAKVFSGRSADPPLRVRWSDSAEEAHQPQGGAAGHPGAGPLHTPELHVLHVPYASTSFMGRRAHSPLDLATVPRPFAEKPAFLGYMACGRIQARGRRPGPT
ncbi:unnamed protein product, partial [Prorocentrum cordatum]